MKRFMTIIFMTSSDCNLDCAYCYIIASRKNKQKFDIKNIKLAISNSSKGFGDVKFCWHGGEPLLVGINFFEKVIEAQTEISRVSGTTFSNSIQSNGTLLNKDWFNFLQAKNFHLGLSFDAPPEVSLKNRGVSQNMMISVYEEMKRRRMSLGTLCVVSKDNVYKSKEIFEFYEKIGLNSFSFLPLKSVPLEDRPIPPNNEELANLYKEIFELWAFTKNNFSCIEPIDTMVRSLLGERPKSCSFASSCLNSMITINQEGYVVPCSSLTSNQFVLGNILEKPLIEILENEKSRILKQERQNHVLETCDGCEFSTICQGGCRVDAFWTTGSYKGKYPFCEARKETFSYIKNRLQETIGNKRQR